MRLRFSWLFLVFVLVSNAPHSLAGSKIEWRSIGMRGGINDNRNDEDFKQYEGFSTWRLPWSRKWDSGWTIGSYLEANAGMLRGGGESAFVGSIGPGIYFTGPKDKIDISKSADGTSHD